MSEEMRFGEAEHKLLVEHRERYDSLVRLLSSLAFGGLMFLLAFQKDYSPPEHSYRWLVQMAWFSMLVSALSGVALQSAIVCSPIRRLEGASISKDQEGRSVIRISGAISKSERLWFWLHVSTFLAAIGALGIYKAVNL